MEVSKVSNVIIDNMQEDFEKDLSIYFSLIKDDLNQFILSIENITQEEIEQKIRELTGD